VSADEHVERTEVGKILPPPDRVFGIAMQDNSFEGDIRVGDLENVIDNGQFAKLKSEYMVDRKGNRRKLSQECGEN